MTQATPRTDTHTGDHPVLVVDDDTGIREVLRQILEDEGHRVSTAANGREALDRLHGDRPCVILLDLMMPVMNGWDFLSRRAEEPVLAEIPVVVITADERARDKATSIGAVECLVKPIDLDRLMDTVGRYCSAI